MHRVVSSKKDFPASHVRFPQRAAWWSPNFPRDAADVLSPVRRKKIEVTPGNLDPSSASCVSYVQLPLLGQALTDLPGSSSGNRGGFTVLDPSDSLLLRKSFWYVAIRSHIRVEIFIYVRNNKKRKQLLTPKIRENPWKSMKIPEVSPPKRQPSVENRPLSPSPWGAAPGGLTWSDFLWINDEVHQIGLCYDIYIYIYYIYIHIIYI